MTTATTSRLPAKIDYGQGADTIVLSIAQDAYLGNAQYQVLVDGKPVDMTFTASALRTDAQADTVTLHGDWGAGPHQITVNYLNDFADKNGDRNLVVNSIAFNGTTVASSAKNLWSNGTFSVTTPIAPTNGAIDYGKGADTLVLKINQDAYQGDAQYIVTVDGKQVGGLFEASALRSLGKTDTLTLHGDWGAGAHAVSVQLVNDFANAGGDRNLFVQSMSYNGDVATKASANIWNGTAVTLQTVARPASGVLNVGAGADTITLSVAQDAYQGDAKYQILVDGKAVDMTFVASATRASGQSDTVTLHGDWGAGPHQISVNYLNDYADKNGDRNLIVNSIAFNGTTVANSAKNIWSNGTFSVTTPVAPTNGTLNYGTGADTLTLKINQDAYLGDAQYTVTVDGKQVGGLFEASASRKAGQTDTVTLHGDWGPGPHDVQVTYVNDLVDTKTGGDRNLFVAGASYNGVTIANAPGSLVSSGTLAFTSAVSLTGTAGADTLVGGKGMDTLRGGHGADTLTGGAGSDLFIHAKGDGADTVTDFTATGASADTIELDSYGFSSFDQIKSHIVQKGVNTVITLDSTDSLTLKNVVASTLTAGNFHFADVTPANTSGFDVGVNLTGPEYVAPADAPAGWKSGIDLFPTQSELQYFAAKGMGTVRLTLSWESLQPSLNGALDPAYLQKIQNTVAQAKALGLDVILDIHNYGAYDGKLIGTSDVPASAFADLWSKLAGTFASADNVKFDLMNEPQQATAAGWLAIANTAIAAIRATGANQEILIPGVHWDSGEGWTTADNAAAFAKPGAIVDPANNYAVEIHQYLDSSGSGTSDSVVSGTIGIDRLTAVTDWARTNGIKLYLGETGVGDDTTSLAALNNMVGFLKANQDVWTGLSYFAAGQGFSSDYMYSAEPIQGVLDRAQMDVLENYVDAKVVRTQLADGTTKVETFGYDGKHASMTDIVGADGHLVSRSIYATDGHVSSQVALQSDGSFLFDAYNTAGQKTEESVMTLNGTTSTMLKDTVYAADHSFNVKVFDPATGAVVHSEVHDTSGKLTASEDDSATAHTRTQYTNGIVTNKSTFDAAWNLTDAFIYSTSGTLTEHDYLNSAGHHLIDQYSATTGKLTSHGDFDANWQMQSWTTINDDGSKLITEMHNDGSKDIDYIAAGATNPYKIDHFGTDGTFLNTQMMPAI